jgi:hypothetical protein
VSVSFDKKTDKKDVSTVEKIYDQQMEANVLEKRHPLTNGTTPGACAVKLFYERNQSQMIVS